MTTCNKPVKLTASTCNGSEALIFLRVRSENVKTHENFYLLLILCEILQRIWRRFKRIGNWGFLRRNWNIEPQWRTKPVSFSRESFWKLIRKIVQEENRLGVFGSFRYSLFRLVLEICIMKNVNLD